MIIMAADEWTIVVVRIDYDVEHEDKWQGLKDYMGPESAASRGGHYLYGPFCKKLFIDNEQIWGHFAADTDFVALAQKVMEVVGSAYSDPVLVVDNWTFQEMASSKACKGTTVVALSLTKCSLNDEETEQRPNAQDKEDDADQEREGDDNKGGDQGAGRDDIEDCEDADDDSRGIDNNGQDKEEQEESKLIGAHFRCGVPDYEIIFNNLAIANMDWHDFANNLGPDGVYWDPVSHPLGQEESKLVGAHNSPLVLPSRTSDRPQSDHECVILFCEKHS